MNDVFYVINMILNWIMAIKLIIILYLIIGFITMLLWNLIDMRGADFDKDFFCQKRIKDSVLLLLFWLPFLIFALFGFIYVEIVCFLKDKRFMTRLLYKIANIGYREEDYIYDFDNISITTPVSGTVVSIETKVNKLVKRDDCVAFILTDGKEIPVPVPDMSQFLYGTVKSIDVAVGDWVKKDATLITLLGCPYEIKKRKKKKYEEE